MAEALVFSFSDLRPKDDIVGSTGGVASGPVSFMKVIDAATEQIKQGSTRRGANMGILNCDHPDILEFIKSKSDGTSLSNFNISVGITTEFMDKVKRGEEYNLVNPHTGQMAGRANASDIFNLIAEMAWKTGDPGLVFLDEINKRDPNPHLGRIKSTNPCGEAVLLDYESCNLASVNLSRMVQYADNEVSVDWELLRETTITGVHLLDNVIDMNKYPIPEIEAMTKRTRRIGLGVMGFSDLLVQLGIPYDSDEALHCMQEIMQYIQQHAHTASERLAETRGSYEECGGSKYTNQMRNTAPVTIAPTGTISIIAGASSGIEPLFALGYERNVMDNTRMVEMNPYFEAVAKSEGFYSAELMAHIVQTGTLIDTDVPDWVKRGFKTAHDISPEWHVRMQAAAQTYTDNAVSKTIKLPA